MCIVRDQIDIKIYFKYGCESTCPSQYDILTLEVMHIEGN